MLANNGIDAWAPSSSFSSRTRHVKSYPSAIRHVSSSSAVDTGFTTTLFATVEENQMLNHDASGEEEPRQQQKQSRDDAKLFSSADVTNKIHGSVAIPYSELTIGVLRERMDGETRVSQTPDSVANLVKAGFTVLVESGGKYVH